MEPEEVIPPITDNIPSDRDKLRSIVERYETDDKVTSENTIYLPEKEVMIKLEGSKMDFDEGQEIMKISVQTPGHNVFMEVKSVFVSEVMIKLKGWHDQEEYHVFP